MSRLLLACAVTIFALSGKTYAQYTETLNSNRPGQSQGAYAVGKNVLQFEAGYDTGSDKHQLLNTDTDIWGIDFSARYGVWKEQLEISVLGRFQNSTLNFTTGNVAQRQFSDFETLTLGAKYLFYDPGKNEEEEVNLYSYWANRKFKWKNLIPSVAVYAGANFGTKDNPFFTVQEGISPTVAIITQNNWGRWVWVNNVIGEYIGTDFPSYTWITTMTHSFTPKIAGFLEFQLINGDLYSDQIIRGGAAYLFTPDFQVDISGLFNLKDTPARQNIALGASYRFDMHNGDEKIFLDDGNTGESKLDKKMKKKAAKKAKKKNKRKDVPDFDGDGI
ncbi:transporter [Dokdonia sinensis]|uniref:Transporter n=1 Tax=Dokdonia sinensis TaxID=2479847 RepID=A0A3M0GCX2_9FLAO|nr:transporter [Dokdonia sinensis]RMB59433.1 transporter [Dokdonia sinensis]